MRRAGPGVIVVSVLGALFLVAPVATQGPGRGRSAVEIVNGREAAAREVLVRFHGVPSPAPADVRGLADSDVFEGIGGTGAFRLRSRSLDVPALLAVLSRRNDVLYVEPNYVVRSFAPPNDALFPQLWGLHNVQQVVNGGGPGSVGSDIGAVAAWDVSAGSAAHVVAIIDTGLDYTHPDLAANIWTAPAPFTVRLSDGTVIGCAAGTRGFDAITRTCNPMDDHGHGTHVAGTVGATGDNGVGVTGVNWTTRLMGIKFLDASGSGTMAGAVDAIRFAVETKRALGSAADVRVLSASWGGTGFSQALLDEINAAGAEGMLLVAAAGNSAMSNDLLPTYPASYTAPNLVSVAATTNTDGRAWFSNYGASSVHLGAPGVDILSTRPQGGYGFASGTSMAAPHVSGTAALVLSRCSYGTAALKEALLGSVRPVEALATITITGGRLDAHSAILTCVAPPPAPTNLSAMSGDGQVLLSWSPALGATGYVVKRSAAAGGPYVTITTAPAAGRFTDTAVVNGTTYHYVVSATNSLGESGNSNEASATPNLNADLAVAALTAPVATAPGAVIDVSVTTVNQGSGPAQHSATRLYLSNDAVFDSTDGSLATHEVLPLQPGESSTIVLPVTIPPGTPAGRWFLLGVADADRQIIESLEWNNTRARSLTIGPDLVVTGLTVPSTAAPGEALTVSDVVKNQGGAAAPASTTTFYLSADALLDASDTLLPGGRAVPTLAPDATSSGTTTLVIPATTPLGSYYLIARADGEGAVVEALETNNTLGRPVRLGADLVVSALSLPATGGAGSPVVVTETTTNQGTTAAGPSVTRFYLSGNLQVDGADSLLGSRAVPGLDRGQSSAGSTTLIIPPDTATGSYFVLALADADIAVVETLESNNQLARSIQIGGDLRISTLTVPATGAPGSSILVSDTTANQGSGPVGASVTRYYFSSDGQLDAQDQLLGGRAVPALGPGAAHSGSASVVLPTNLTTGTYYVIARADADESVIETQEGNNLASRAMQIGGDLRISAFSAPPAGGAGLPLIVTDTTTNQGTAAVPASVTSFYLSTNAVLDGGDTLLPDVRAVPSLPAGAASAGSSTLTLPAMLPTGVYYLFAKADGGDAIVETQESNNTALRSIQIGPDLAISALSAPAKAEAGATMSVSEATVNQGGGSAPASVTAFALSADWKLDDEDVRLAGSRAVGPLAPGQTSTASTGVTIPAGIAPASYYLIAIADDGAATPETSETNNVRWQTIRVGPDLAVSTASLSLSTIRAGASASIGDTVLNQGAGLAAASATRFYLSSDTTLDGADVRLAGGRAVPPLATNASSSGTTVVTIPAETAAGTYWILAVADGDGAVAESVETNNVRLVRSIQITPP